MIQIFNLLNSKKKILTKFVNDSISRYSLIDVGASLPVNKYYTLLNKKFKFYFIEPNKTEAIKLKNFCKKNFSYFEICNNLISSKRKNYFYYYKNYQLNSILKRNDISFFNRSNSSQEVINKKKIDSVTLEKIIKKNEINTKKCLLKIDVQGTVIDVLKSIKKKNFLFPVVLCECDRFKIYKNQSLDFEIIKFMQDNQYIPLGDICKYDWSYHIKKKEKKIYPKYKFSKEISYSSDILFIKNPFNKNLKKNDVLIIFLFCCIFQYYDFAEYLIGTLFKNSFKKKDIYRYIQLVKKLNNIDKKIIEKNFNYIYSKKKFDNYNNFLSYNSEYFVKKFGLV